MSDYSYTFEHCDGYVCIRLEGMLIPEQLTAAEFEEYRQHIEVAREHSDRFLIDVSRSTNFRRHEGYTLGSRLANFYRELRVAVLGDPDVHVGFFALALKSEGITAEQFFEFDQAVAWLKAD